MKKRKYQIGGQIDYNAVFQKAAERDRLKEQQNDAKIQNIFGLAGTAASFIPGANFLAPILPLAGQAVANMFQTGGLMKIDGGTDEQLSSTAFQVNGYPNTTDGNSYVAQSANIKLDNNEVVNNNYVFSDIIYDPRTGKKFSDTANRIQKNKGLAEKTLQSNPNDITAANTIKHLVNITNSLQNAQETVANQLGYRDTKSNYQTGGNIDANYYKLPSTTPVIDPLQYRLPKNTFEIPSVSPTDYALPPTTVTKPFPGISDLKDKILEAQNSSVKMQTGGSIQQQGYKDNSPYNNLPYIDINSNNITMRDVSSPVMAYPNNDSPTMMMPGMDYLFPNSTKVREVKLQTGGNWIEEFQNAYSSTFPDAKYKPTKVFDKKTKELLESEYGKQFIKNNNLYYDPTNKGVELSPLNEVRSLARQGLRRTSTNLAPIVDSQGNPFNFNFTETPKLPAITRSPATSSPENGLNKIASIRNDVPVTGNANAAERLNRIDFRSNNSGDNNFGFLKNNLGDIAQFAEVGSKFIGLFKSPEKEELRVDPTQITKQSVDNSAAMYQTNRNYFNQISNMNTGSVNLDRALKTNAYATKLNQDSRIISEYDRLNNELMSDYERRIQERNRYNIQRQDYTNTVNSQNRAAYDNAMQNAFTSLGNLGQAYNERKAQNEILEMYKKFYSTI